MIGNKEKLGIYGGTFSPIHEGHILAGIEFFRRMELDKLIIMPTAKPPHKAEVAGANEIHRLTMARLAFEDFSEYRDGKIEISDFEIAKGDKSYTVETLRHYKADGRAIYLLVGTDMFLTLGRWYLAEEIFALANIVLFRREDEPEFTSQIEEKTAEYKEKFSARLHFINGKPKEISSTELRLKIAAGEDVSGLVPDKVAQYISENRLYR